MILFSDDKNTDSDFEEVIKMATTNFQKEQDIFFLVVRETCRLILHYKVF